jgi:hypothetical protein
MIYRALEMSFEFAVYEKNYSWCFSMKIGNGLKFVRRTEVRGLHVNAQRI